MLRSGEVTSFPALLRRVLEDVRQDTAFSPSGATNTTNGKAAANGTSDENGATAVVNGSKKGDATNGAATNGSTGDRPSLAMPQNVVDEALKVTRDCLESVCEIDESGAT